MVTRGFTATLVILIALGLGWQWQVIQHNGHWLDMWLSRDQQGQWYFQRGQYALAASRFVDPHWRAAALYAAQDFTAAEILWQRQSGASALLNRGNALAHLQRYRLAADSYQLALQLRPDWPAAQRNLQLVVALAQEAEPVTDFSGDTEVQLEADEVVFDEPDSARMQQAEDSQVDGDGGLSSQEIQALWLRRLTSTPADFLRLKFSYQWQEQQAAQSQPGELR